MVMYTWTYVNSAGTAMMASWPSLRIWTSTICGCQRYGKRICNTMKEGNVLFHALNTFYLQLYDNGHMVKDQSDSKRGNLLLPLHGLLFLISFKESMYHSTDRIAYTMAFVIPVVEHQLEWEMTQWVHNEGSINDPWHHEWKLFHGATLQYKSLFLHNRIRQFYQLLYMHQWCFNETSSGLPRLLVPLS